VETALEVLVALARRRSFRDLAGLTPLAVAGGRLTPEEAGRIQRLCSFAQRLMDLDAEDFGRLFPAIETTTEVKHALRVGADAVPHDLVRRAAACRMPQAPDEPDPGALGSLLPVYRLMLELIAVRWERGEVLLLLAALHIAAEYAPLLAWEAALGHPRPAPDRRRRDGRGQPVGTRRGPRLPAPARVQGGRRAGNSGLRRRHRRVGELPGSPAQHRRGRPRLLRRHLPYEM
jgi:hypothetical protein